MKNLFSISEKTYIHQSYPLMTTALTTHVVTHIAKTRTDYSGVISGIEIPCTANMVEAIRQAKTDGASYIQLPNVMKPTENAWE